MRSERSQFRGLVDEAGSLSLAPATRPNFPSQRPQSLCFAHISAHEGSHSKLTDSSVPDQDDAHHTCFGRKSPDHRGHGPAERRRHKSTFCGLPPPASPPNLDSTLPLFVFFAVWRGKGGKGYTGVSRSGIKRQQEVARFVVRIQTCDCSANSDIGWVTRRGLFLRRGDHSSFYESVAYGKQWLVTAVEVPSKGPDWGGMHATTAASDDEHINHRVKHLDLHDLKEHVLSLTKKIETILIEVCLCLCSDHVVASATSLSFLRRLPWPPSASLLQPAVSVRCPVARCQPWQPPCHKSCSKH